MRIVQATDFTGFYDISQNSYQQDNLEVYIEKYEKDYLREITTDEVQKEIEDATELTEALDKLINGCQWTDDNGITRTNSGLKKVLVAFIYYHYVADNFTNRMGGNYQLVGENAIRTDNSQNSRIVYSRYNEGVRIYNKDIVPFIQEFDEIYIDYNLPIYRNAW